MSYYELSQLVTFRPLSDDMKRAFGGIEKLIDRERPRSRFEASWSSTVEVLAREVRHLRPRQAVMELHFVEGQFRNDGLPRATAKAFSPAVVLTLTGTPHGDLRYPCDTFRTWEDNVRAIALALEALRKVDRYGVTRRGEQYAGWKQLPAGSGPSAGRGRDLIRKHGSVTAALKATHPDHGGDPVDFADVQAAREESV